jgi:hypothetical protein
MAEKLAEMLSSQANARIKYPQVTRQRWPIRARSYRNPADWPTS